MIERMDQTESTEGENCLQESQEDKIKSADFDSPNKLLPKNIYCCHILSVIANNDLFDLLYMVLGKTMHSFIYLDIWYMVLGKKMHSFIYLDKCVVVL